MAIEAYCVKCKAKKEMKDPVESLSRRASAPTAVPRFAVSALRNNLALTDDEKDGLGRPFLHYEGVSRETINEDSKGEERSRQMRGRVRSSTGDNGCSIRINMFHVKHLSHCCETLRFMFHVKQSALAIFYSFLGAAFVRLTHEA